MNIIVLPIVCLVSLTLAEPPVGDGYPAARSSDHHHDHDDHNDHIADHDRSPPQEYGAPSFGTRNAISSEYAPNTRNSPNQGQSRKHAPATRLSFNQRFSSAASRSSAEGHNLANNADQGYANARSGVSQDPESRSLSQEYGVPSEARPLSRQNSVPARSLAVDHGTPVARSNQRQSSNIRNRNSLPQDYSPKSRSQTGSSSRHSASLARSNAVEIEAANSYPKSSDAHNLSQHYGGPKDSPSKTYGTPQSSSTSFAEPSTRNADSTSQDYSSIAHSYTSPSERDLSETYGAPNARSLSEEYGAPSSRNNEKTDAVASSYTASSRTSPSSRYLPAARGNTPSQQYGVPDQDSQGYEYSRARALEELNNQEPANYDFAYQIEDQESGSDFGHSETRQGNRAQGSYFVVLPDGSKQTVEYEADERGYKPRITVEPPAGYDQNAQDLARSSQGPY